MRPLCVGLPKKMTFASTLSPHTHMEAKSPFSCSEACMRLGFNRKGKNNQSVFLKFLKRICIWNIKTSSLTISALQGREKRLSIP